MAKCLLKLLGTTLLIAALTVLSGAGLAQDSIATGTVCSKKVAPGSWHLCGALPGPGTLIYEGAGTHELTVFTTGPDVNLGPAGPNPICAGDWQDLGIKQIQCRLKPGERGLLKNVSTGDLVYVARRDRVLSDRTIGVLFLDVSGDLGDAPSAFDSRIRIEVNSTTGEAGVRASVDGEGESLSSVRIVGPNQRIFQASGGNLGQLGLAELAFETHAPALEELIALLPEGEYRLQGRTVAGDRILHTASLTHGIPDGPAILTPEEGAVVDPEDAVISWDPVTESAGIEIAGYRVIVERGDRGRSLSLDLSPETTDVLVPPGFLELGTDYLFKVLAIEAGGNQTISEGAFETAQAGDIGADPIVVDGVCMKRVFVNSTTLCGTAPGTGNLLFTNISTHLVALFTIAKGTNTSAWDGSTGGAANFARHLIKNIKPNAQDTIPLVTGDRVYIGRSDHTLSNRTIGVRFDQVP